MLRFVISDYIQMSIILKKYKYMIYVMEKKNCRSDIEYYRWLEFLYQVELGTDLVRLNIDTMTR